jgi:hypothetical protein
MAYCSPVPTRIAGMGSAAHRQSQLRRPRLRRDSSRVRRAALWRANGWHSVSALFGPHGGSNSGSNEAMCGLVGDGAAVTAGNGIARPPPPAQTAPSAFRFVDPTPELHVARPKAD